ncbi:hypothetical protein Cgig2_005051 [Carnegiea gigantea]|uniref:Bidirectional sugar transporter SWEET n=1 Tax=Carnegiea gigantea TaxID=171969 RepID=A0A9Q1QUH2_9CARY|nr:hypothetical protein Cgig2_005051 [Carnegiea gigantea]
MGDKLRIAAGVMGTLLTLLNPNAASMLLFAAPMYSLTPRSCILNLFYSTSPLEERLTFSRVIKKRSTQEFSCVPYIVALLNCLIYAWYGLPIVSCGWENFPLIPINGLGILLESSFIVIYLWFASSRGKVKVAAMTLPVIALFCMTALISAFLFHDRHHRKVFVGTVGLVASSAMYGSPLVAVKKVIKTKSVGYMPFSLSLFSFLASSLWMAYGLLSHDLFLAFSRGSKSLIRILCFANFNSPDPDINMLAVS